MKTTTKLTANHTTRLLDDLADPRLRALAFFAVVTILVSIGGIVWNLRAVNATPAAIIIVATATPVQARPTLTPPTITPAPVPEVRELPSGAIVAWDGHTWQLLKDAPGQVEQPAAAQVTQAQEQPAAQIQATYDSQGQAPEVEVEQPQAQEQPPTAAPAAPEPPVARESFAAPDCAPQFVGYLPGHPCYGKP